MHECPHCHYRFEDPESLRRHLEEGNGCPELNDDETAKVTLEISNFYEGEEIRTRVETRVPMPPRVEDQEAFSEWEYDHLFPHTGTGRTEGDSAYFVKIVESDDPELVGHEAEFGT